MSEKPPQFERPPIPVFGDVAEDDKQKISEELETRFKEGEITDLSEAVLEKIKRLEYEKKAYELDFIKAADEITNRFREKYGLSSFNVSEKNIHILPSEALKKLDNTSAASYFYSRQIITANAEILRYHDNRIYEAGTLLHEITHLKGFLSIDAEKKSDGMKKSSRRVGLTISEGYQKSNQDEWYESFRGLNEAVVSEIEQRYAKEVAPYPVLTQKH